MKIKSLKVTRTLNYSPEGYIEYCEVVGEPPTQEGFFEFVQECIYEDFQNWSGMEEIVEVE